MHKTICNIKTTAVQEKSEYEKIAEEMVKKWEICHKSGMEPKEIQEILGFSRATYFRRKKFLGSEVARILKSRRPKNLRKTIFGKDIYDLVLKLRTESPTYGKAKIAAIMKRDHKVQISESSVGRILKKLKVPRSQSAPKVKKRRKFDKHAKRWTFKKHSDMKLGERVQIDHMTDKVAGGPDIKHFGAWERFSKYMHANCYSNATSNSAKRFLYELVEVAPYDILSIQVDGGCEFMDEFEEACRELGIELIVLPPAKPKYNGGVERSNGIFRNEFYNDPRRTEYTVTGTRRELLKAVEKYNNYRPHFALKGLTPMEYIKSVQETTVLSQNT